MDYIDVTYPVDETLRIYPGDPLYTVKPYLAVARGDLCNVAAFSMGCHTGTHMDAPLHFVEGAASVDQVDLSRINGEARVIEYKGGPGSDISVDFLESCNIQPKERVIFKTSNSRRFGGRTLLDDYTAIDEAAADWLVRKQVSCIGIDYMTIEPAKSTDGAVHRCVLGAAILVIESLDLRETAAGRYRLVCLPLRLAGLDGSPVRALLYPLAD